MTEKKSSVSLSAQRTDDTVVGSNLMQDTREFIEENLIGALLDWLKAQTLYKNVTSEDKTQQQNIFKGLADKLISIVEQSSSNGDDNIDPMLLEELKKHVEKLPINHALKSDHKFMNELPAQILGHLKGLKLFHDISQHNDISSFNRNIEHSYNETPIDNNITKWIENLPLSKVVSSEKVNLKNLKGILVERIKQTDKQYESKLREEAKNFLQNVSLDVEDLKEKEKLLNEFEDDLIVILMNKPLKLRSGQLSNKFVIKAVEQWVKTLDLQKPYNDRLDNILDKARNDMIVTLSNKFIYAEEVPYKNYNEVFQDAINSFLEKMPKQQYKTEDINILEKSLEDTFKEYSKKYPMFLSKKTVKKKGATILLDNIAEWFKKLLIESSTPEEKSESEKTKLQLESKLIHKIGEMNVSIEVFNDDFLYEDILDDEIDNLLRNILSENVQSNLPQLKKELKDIVLKARQIILDESATQIYKQQLYKTISNTLPYAGWSDEGRASLEVLKNKVADAFINMRYNGNDSIDINKLKKKIDLEIHQFCNSYLKRCPATPLDTTQLNKNLYNALNSIAEPNNASFVDEVEIVKLKHEINKWLEDLPSKDRDAHDKLQQLKMVSALAKKIHDIENETELSSQEYDKKLLIEITRFLKRQPLKTDNEKEINELAKLLVKSLNDTENYRKFNSLVNKPFGFRATKRNPKIKISFNDASIGLCSKTKPEFKDCGVGACLTSGSKKPEIEKKLSVQTSCASSVQPVGSQTGVRPVEEYNEGCYWESTEKTCMPTPRVSYSSPTNFHLPNESVPECTQKTCFLPQEDSRCTQEALKSCLITRPYPPQPYQIQSVRQHQIRECDPSDYNDDNYDFQYPYEPPEYRPDISEVERTQSSVHSSRVPNPYITSTPYSTLERSQTRQSAPWELPQQEGSSPMYPYFLSTESPLDRQEYDSQRTLADCSQYRCPGQPCSMSHQISRQKSVVESQFIPLPQQGSIPLQSESPNLYNGTCQPRYIQGQIQKIPIYIIF